MSYVYDYPTNLSLYSFGFSDPEILRSFSPDSDPLFSSNSAPIPRNSSPPRHRHDGTSPLPLGMDWSPPPPTWNGRHTLWPHDHHTGWSYCVTIPSWIILPGSSGSDPAVFYRVQVAVQSPDGITTIRGILRRFNNFLKLFSDLKSEFPKKSLPPAPARTLLRMKNKDYLEERRHALEDWMEKLLSDIDVSRNVHVAIFLELEAAARSSFYDSNQIDVNENLPANEVALSNHTPTNSGASSPEAGLLVVSNSRKSFASDQSEIRRPRQIRDDDDTKVGLENSSVNQDSTYELEKTVGDSSSEHTDDQVMSNSDMEDLIARLNQEVAVKNYLTEKVKDLEVELETTKQTAKENLHHVVVNEGEKLTQMKKDAEDFKRNLIELELKLKAEQDEKKLMESRKSSIIQQNEILQQELNVAREKLDILLKHHEELELKSKSDIKLLIKEVKSLRSCQLELRDEVSRLMEEKTEGERVLQLEKQKRESANAANLKLLHECEVLLNRLKDCSINIHIEGDDKLTIDTSLPADAVDRLTTCDNQIDLLLEEAQTLSLDVEDNKAANGNINGTKSMTSDDELRLMLTSIVVDNARLRKQVNSVIRCVLNSSDKAGNICEVEEEASLSSGNTQLK